MGRDGDEFAYGSAYVVFAAIETARDAQVR
jgi:hypothetical protein